MFLYLQNYYYFWRLKFFFKLITTNILIHYLCVVRYLRLLRMARKLRFKLNDCCLNLSNSAVIYFVVCKEINFAMLNRIKTSELCLVDFSGTLEATSRTVPIK